MKRTILVCCLGAALAAGVQAASTVQCQVKGRGANRDKALQNALLNAVTKVHGAVVGTSVARVNLDTGNLNVDVDAPTGNRRISMDRVAVQSAGTLTLTEAQGLIKSYDVVSEQQVDDHTYEVTANVWVLDYQGPEAVKAIRLAVLPARVTARTFRFGPHVVSNTDVSRQFTQFVTEDLSRNDRFTLLDRESTAVLNQERRVLAQPDVKPEEKSRLEATLGADYLVVVTLPQAELIVTKRDNAIIGQPIRKFDARLRAEFRLLVGPTRQVSMADSLRIHLEDNQVKALAQRWRTDEIDYAELQMNFLRLAAGRVALKVAEVLTPIKIAAVLPDHQQVILNQGGPGFVRGDLFRVYWQGKSVVDPDTQTYLASQEKPLGAIRITRVLAKVSYATIVKGTFDPNAVGAVCWHAWGLEDQPTYAPGGRQSEVHTTPSGGVKLPFDH